MVGLDKEIYVFADWFRSDPILIGKLYVANNRGKEVFSFEYDPKWLKENLSNIFLDPDLSLYAGSQYTPIGKEIFGIFSDSCPDRWGRSLMNRREAISAKQENRKPRALGESDYLLGVYDQARIGALRFSLKEDGPFLSDNIELSTPPWTTLRSLETASMAYENSEPTVESKWFKQLLAPGSSLGGARPKASVQAPDASLWIAKFPSKNDEWDSGAWEMVVHDLAQKCYLSVPEARLESFSEHGSTYLVKRFDREAKKRIHFTSAMALLGKTDGRGSDETSYLDIASFIKSNGAYPSQDLLELWKRIVFSISVSNTDDHLRNHGFILSEAGWKLSPMFDVNPNIYGHTMSLNITQNDNLMDIDLALEVSEHFGIRFKDAKIIAEEIRHTVKTNWRKFSLNYGLTRSSIESMEPAFYASDR